MIEERVYRSRGQSVVVAIVGLAGSGAVVGIMFEARQAESLILAGLLLLLLLALCGRAMLAGVAVKEQGIKIRNVLSTTEVSWSEIKRFDIGRSGVLPLVCLVHLEDGRAKHAYGIQERTNFPSGDAAEIADELNAELRQRRPT